MVPGGSGLYEAKNFAVALHKTSESWNMEAGGLRGSLKQKAFWDYVVLYLT